MYLQCPLIESYDSLCQRWWLQKLMCPPPCNMIYPPSTSWLAIGTIALGLDLLRPNGTRVFLPQDTAFTSCLTGSVSASRDQVNASANFGRNFPRCGSHNLLSRFQVHCARFSVITRFWQDYQSYITFCEYCGLLCPYGNQLITS